MALLRRLAPAKPACRISRATRLRLMRIPISARSICRRGAPYVPFEAACAARISSINASSITARVLADVRRQFAVDAFALRELEVPFLELLADGEGAIVE